MHMCKNVAYHTMEIKLNRTNIGNNRESLRERIHELTVEHSLMFIGMYLLTHYTFN